MKQFSPLLIVLLTATGAESATSPRAPVELPTFVVNDERDLPAPEEWMYARVPGFEVLTNAPPGRIRQLLGSLQTFRQGLAYIWPAETSLEAIPLIITGRGGYFNLFMPQESSAPQTAKASLFLRRGDRAAIVLDAQTATLDVPNSGGHVDAGTNPSLIAVEPDKQLFREFIRYQLSGAEPRFPAWFEEGLAQILMRMQLVDARTIEIARLEDPNAISAEAGLRVRLKASADVSKGGDGIGDVLPGAPAEDRDFNYALRERALIPMQAFFSVTHDSPDANNPLGSNVWAKQAYAFVHMCLYGENGRFLKSFFTFVGRARREEVSQSLVKECFALSYNDLLIQLRSYCDFTVYQVKGIRAIKGAPDLIVSPAAVDFRTAKQGEVARIKAQALILAGKQSLAHTELRNAYSRGERDPALLAELGLMERQRGDPERGAKLLEAAYAGGERSVELCFSVATLRFAAANNKPEGPVGKFSLKQVHSVQEPLFRALSRKEHSFAAYELLAETWLRSSITPTVHEASVVAEGAKRYSTRLKLTYHAVLITREAGDLKTAVALAKHGAATARDDKARVLFESLKSEINTGEFRPQEHQP